MNRRFHLLKVLGFTADLQGHQAALFQNTQVHVHAFGDPQLLPEPGHETTASPLPQQ